MLPIAILAGGLATRLRPVTLSLPKSLIEVAGEPFIAHQLRWIRSQGIRYAVLCVGYLGEQIEAFVRDGSAFGLDVAYSWDGAMQRGTAGALKNALPLLGNEFFVTYGDSYLPCSFSQVERAFLLSNKQGLMTVFHNRGRWDSSNVELFEGTIRCYSKKNRTVKMQHIDYGLGVLRREALDRIPNDMVCDLSEFYEMLLHDGQLAAYEVNERFYEVGSFRGIQDISALFSRQQV